MSRLTSRALSYRQREAARARKSAIGAAVVLGGMTAAFGGLLYLAAAADEAHGISVSESLRNNGIHGAAYVAEAFESERPAVQVRLIGECGGRYYAAKEESAFPANCTWIEPIREVESK
jgi:hypothetical protein